MSSSSDKKMRREASPDEGTFTSQQEFLDSLAPVPLETIEANNRKCGYCWRNYGEANPDQDDAEAPVQFKKCNHVFGEQCMRMLFAIRDPVRVELKPLSFALGSKGADLGSRLHSYVESRGVKKSALLTGGSREKDFVQMLRELRPAASVPDHVHKNGIKLLGSVWYGLYYEMYVQADAQPGKIHLLENAIVLDREITAAEKSPTASYWNPSLPSAPTSSLLAAHLGLSNDKPVCFGNSYSEPYYNSPPGHLSPFSFSPYAAEKSGIDELEAIEKNLIQYQQKLEGQGFDELLNKHAEEVLKQMNAKKLVDKHMQQKNLSKGSEEDLKLLLKHKQKLAEEKLQKEVQTIMPKKPSEDDLYKNVEQLVQEQMKQINAWQNDAQSKIDSLVASSDKLKASTGEAHGKQKNLIPPTIGPSQGYSPALSMSPAAPPPPVPSKSSLPPIKLPGLSSLNEPTPHEILKSSQAFKKKQAKQQAESQEKRYNLFTTQLASAFATVYAAYERYLIEDALATGRSPPVKKLRLADSKHLPTTSESPAESAAPDSPPGTKYILVRPRVVNLIGKVHDGTKNDKGLLVNQPFPLGATAPDDSDDDDPMDEDKVEAFFAGKVIFVKRVMCEGCFKPGPYVCAPQAPEHVFWEDKKSVPNDCPRCRRILFKK